MEFGENNRKPPIRKVLVLVSGFSPRFNHIPSVRITKLAKFLSKHFKVYVVGGLPKDVCVNQKVDVGTAELIDISGVSLNRSNLSGSAQKATNRSLKLKIKIFLGPLIMFLFSLSSGGGIYYKKKEYILAIDKIISKHQSNQVIILTSYNPWFIIQIGGYFKRKYDEIFWINDYRDLPFDNIVEPLTKFKFFRAAAKWYTDKSDLTICVTKEIEEGFKLIALDPRKVLYYPNGYDLDDLPLTSNYQFSSTDAVTDKLVITYTGRFYQNGTRELTPFVAALAHAMTHSNFDFVFEYAGSQGQYVGKVFSDFGLSDKLNVLGVLSRSEAIKLQKSSDLLLLISYTGDDDARGDGIVTGKFFEYALAKKPIMVIGSDGWELKELLLNDYKNALIRYSETTKISDHLMALFEAKRSGERLFVKYQTDEFDNYNHKNLAKKLAGKFKYS